MEYEEIESDVSERIEKLCKKLDIMINLRDFLKCVHNNNMEYVINDYIKIKKKDKSIESIYEELFVTDITKAIKAMGLILKLHKYLDDDNLLNPIKKFINNKNARNLFIKNQSVFIDDVFPLVLEEDLFSILLKIGLDIKWLTNDLSDYPNYLCLKILANPVFYVEIKKNSKTEEFTEKFIKNHYRIYGRLPVSLRMDVECSIKELNEKLGFDVES